MSAITTKFVKDHNLADAIEMSLEELSRYAPEILELLTTGDPLRIGRHISQVPPGLEAEVNISQISVSTCSEETIKETAQRIVRDNLSERDVKAISRTLAETASYPVVALSRLSRLRRESLEKDEERARELLTWIQEAISSRQLRDPEKPGSTYISAFLKKDEFIPKSYEPLLPSSLRKLGAVFASVVHSPKNPSKVNSYISEALCHSPDNHTAPSDRYAIVNFRRRGQPYDQANPFIIFDEN
ncbi:hypothetical protein RhiirC2_796147 [Rhizophagus irregularis]|uniref:Uncharacterized protein n=1 Tax=Rhizophagus irregularis TaxID=588596 RepID=A0A2N1MA86_9GLOM|nr:hypothetical protein RhiirC2_796147 [Rhizophagus irregularis]